MNVSRVRLVLVTLGTGLLAGLMSGLLGVGGGIVMVPLLVAFGGLTQHEAHGTSLAAIVPIAAVGAATFAADAELEWAIGALLSLGALAGAPLGARLLARSREATLKIMFGLLMIAVAVQLLAT